MINKEEIEMLDGFFNKGWCCDLDEIYNIVMRLKDRVEELEEINAEHQKLNGELQKKLTKLENENKRLQEIIDGKAVQEMGTSDLYKED